MSAPPPLPPGSRLLLLAGPTATGKSAVALRLAERLGGEIISVDSMQVYRGMDIGTAKPSPADRARVPHHLLDVVEVTESFDAARFVQLARAAVAEISARGRWAILCGGTGLYFKAFLEGLSEAPSADPALRAELEATPLPLLLDELARRDPPTYERIDRKNLRRVIRAVEVIRLTGKPFSALRLPWQQPGALPREAVAAWVLNRPAADLRQRIDRRVEEMFRDGLVAETARLLEAGLDRNPIAMQALGYRQVVEHLRGERPLPETVELVKTRTRRFARRQLTWFKRQLPFQWLMVDPSDSPEPVAERLARELAVKAPCPGTIRAP